MKRKFIKKPNDECFLNIEIEEINRIIKNCNEND